MITKVLEDEVFQKLVDMSIYIRNLCQIFKYMNIHIQQMDNDLLSMHIHIH